MLAGPRVHERAAATKELLGARGLLELAIKSPEDGAAAPAKQSDSVGESLRQVRAIHRSGQSDEDTALSKIVAGLPSAVSQEIRAGDVAAIQREVMPAVQTDPTLAEWLSQPDVGDWLTSYLQRLRSSLNDDKSHAVMPLPALLKAINDDDSIV